MPSQPLRATQPPGRRLPLCLAIAAALATGFAPQAGAATRTWNAGAANDNWTKLSSTISNWWSGSSASRPANGDSLVFQGTSGLTNNNDYASLSVAGISFAAGAGAFTLNGNALTSTGDIGNKSSNLQTINLGVTLGANQTWDGGTAGMSFNGVVTLSDHALTLSNGTRVNNATTDLTVGSRGAGALTIESGSVVSSQSGDIGYKAGSSGTVTVSGAGSRWNNAIYTFVGYGGSGTLTVQDGGVVRDNRGHVGYAGGSGTATVSGTGSQWNNVYQLFVGMDGSNASGTLNILDSGKVTAPVLTIADKGIVNLAGGTLEIGSATNAGQFNWTSGTLAFTGDASLGTALLGRNTTLGTGQSLTVNTTLTVDANSVLKLAGGQAQAGALNLAGQVTVGSLSTLSVGSGGLDNGGLLQLAGGTLTGAGALVNNADFTGFGTIAGSGGFTNNGLLTQAGGALVLSNSGANVNYGNWDLLAGGQLQLNGASLGNFGALNLNGGLITGSGTLSNTVAGTIYGRGVISSNFANQGTLVIDSGLTRISKDFANSGQILLGSNSALLAGGAIANSGYLQGIGQVGNDISNRGTIAAQGGLLTLNGALSNSGILTADSGATLRVSSGLADNAGQIRLAGGSFDNHGQALVNSGTISGYGTLSSGTLNNNGQILLAGGVSSLHADIVGNAGSRMILSGASNTTFNGTVDIRSGAELGVSAGSVATFFGQVSQRTGAILSGGGVKNYEGGLSIGASPGFGSDEGSVVFADSNVYLAEIGGISACTLACGSDDTLKNSSYDRYVVGGLLTLGGTLKLTSWNGFVAQAGQRFDLLDWGSESGNFMTIDASGLTLAAGTRLDYSKLYTSGEISVTAVPEPESWAMLLAGLGLIGAIARRRKVRNEGQSA